MKHTLSTLLLVLGFFSFSAYSQEKPTQETYEVAYDACKEQLEKKVNDEVYVELLKECLVEKGFDKISG
ncbi:MAG: hypothetical protein KTR20_01145 [Cellvibrionaceae bacterium]|nr:hypothetical protein [Cellvibrionaceae bacterium]